jgi:hypothetical protein
VCVCVSNERAERERRQHVRCGEVAEAVRVLKQVPLHRYKSSTQRADIPNVRSKAIDMTEALLKKADETSCA